MNTIRSLTFTGSPRGVVAKNKKGAQLRRFVALLECNSPNHTDCFRLQDGIMKIGNVLESYITDTIMDGKHYCICASGIVDSTSNKLLNSVMKRVKWGRWRKVKYIKFIMDDGK